MKAKHILCMRALFYLYLWDDSLGNNKSQARLNAAKGLNIFMSWYLFLPLLSRRQWHWASCLIANHGFVVDKSNKDPNTFPCILELNSSPKSTIVDHVTILAWLNEEYQLRYSSKESPFTRESMPYFCVPCKLLFGCCRRVNLLYTHYQFDYQ